MRIGEDFGVYTEIFLVVKKSEDGIGDSPYTDLHRRPVIDEQGDIACDPFRDCAAFPECEFEQRFLEFHEMPNLGHVDEAVAEGSGHARIDLCYD